jgi:S-layer homology domain
MFSRTRRRRFITLAVAAFLVVPATVFASDGFIDVPDTQIFHGDIAWMDANGITSGCGGGNYCPDDNVTRGQMAAFMKRLATKKVVNAATAETAVSATTATTAGNGAVAHGYYSGPSFEADGFSTFSNPSTGVYCLGLDPTLGVDISNVIAQVTVEWGSSLGSDLSAFWWRGAGSCPVDNIEVRTYDFESAGANFAGVQSSADVAFVVTLWETSGLVNVNAPVASLTSGDRNGS